MLGEKIFCISYFYIHPKHRTALIEELIKLVEPTRNEPGCIYYELYLDKENPNLVVLSSKFVNLKALDDHEKQPYIVRFLEGPMNKYCEKVTWSEATEIKLSLH